MIHTYPNVSQFWTYKPEEFLKNPVYSRDFPPAKNLERREPLQYWAIQTLNSLALGGLLFLLAAGFSLIFGLMRIANLTHGALYMLGAYIGVSILKVRAQPLARGARSRGAGRRAVRRPAREIRPAGSWAATSSARCW